MAMAMGTVAPPPAAWSTLAETIHGKLGATATKADPMANTSSASWKIFTRPWTSDSRPAKGMATV